MMTGTTAARPRAGAPRMRLRERFDEESGQATAEYALVMLAAAALAGSLLAWAVGTDAIGRLMGAVIDSLIDQASP